MWMFNAQIYNGKENMFEFDMWSWDFEKANVEWWTISKFLVGLGDVMD
jgi:hypothetical protein